MQSCRLGGALHTILWDAEPGAIRRDTDTVRAFGQVRGRGLVHAVRPSAQGSGLCLVVRALCPVPPFEAP